MRKKTILTLFVCSMLGTAAIWAAQAGSAGAAAPGSPAAPAAAALGVASDAVRFRLPDLRLPCLRK